MSLADAREAHMQARAQIAKGVDPRKSTSDKKCFSYYALEKMKALDLRDATYVKRLGRMEKYLFDELEKKDVTAITPLATEYRWGWVVSVSGVEK